MEEHDTDLKNLWFLFLCSVLPFCFSFFLYLILRLLLPRPASVVFAVQVNIKQCPIGTEQTVAELRLCTTEIKNDNYNFLLLPLHSPAVVHNRRPARHRRNHTKMYPKAIPNTMRTCKLSTYEIMIIVIP